MTSQASRNNRERMSAQSVERQRTAENVHHFSASYQQHKRALIAECGGAQAHAGRRQGKAVAKPGFKVKAIAAAAAAALVVVPVSAWAVANNADFFAGAFGNSARENVQVHESVQEYKDGNPVMVTYPTREYTEVDLDKAEALLGNYTSSEQVEVPMGDHTLTVLSTVRDKDSMVVHYTLEREGGVTLLDWKTSDYVHGALQPNDAPYKWLFTCGIDEAVKSEQLASWQSTPVPENTEERAAYEKGLEAAQDDHAYANYAGGFTLVDEKRSTPDKLYCYDCIIFTEAPAANTPVSLHVHKQDEDGYWSGKEGGCQITEIPAKQAISGRTLTAAGVGSLDVTPLSLVFAHAGDGDIVDEGIERIRYDESFADRTTFEEYLAGRYDDSSVDLIAKIVVNYKDGSSYVAYDENDSIYNLAYCVGRLNDDAVYMFNRLVDPQDIESITINDVVFS